MKIFAACPECGCTDWIRFDSGGFVLQRMRPADIHR